MRTFRLPLHLSFTTSGQLLVIAAEYWNYWECWELFVQPDLYLDHEFGELDKRFCPTLISRSCHPNYNSIGLDSIRN